MTTPSGTETLDVVVVGDLMVDVLAVMSGPLAHGSDTPSRITTAGGGSAANVASWLSELGVRTSYVGKVGDDALGRESVAGLSLRGVEAWVSTADGLTTGQQHEHHVDVASNTQRLKVTLVWTEPPGAVNATTAIVNDLDLEVVSPGGAQLFRGNVFAAGVSATGGAADTGNNVECVLVNAPAAGDWTIRVRATAVNVGNPGTTDAFRAGIPGKGTPRPDGLEDRETRVPPEEASRRSV